MIHDFADCLKWSEGVEVNANLLQHLVALVPGATGYRKANETEDWNGTDMWIDRTNGRALSVDFKHRRICPLKTLKSDDACIEVVSQYTGEGQSPYDQQYIRKIGWTFDKKKQTDFIAYTWPSDEDHLRFWLVSFPLLCRAAIKNGRDWLQKYAPPSQTRNATYWTINCYVPREVIKAEIEKISEGIL